MHQCGSSSSTEQGTVLSDFHGLCSWYFRQDGGKLLVCAFVLCVGWCLPGTGQASLGQPWSRTPLELDHIITAIQFRCVFEGNHASARPSRRPFSDLAFIWAANIYHSNFHIVPCMAVPSRRRLVRFLRLLWLVAIIWCEYGLWRINSCVWPDAVTPNVGICFSLVVRSTYVFTELGSQYHGAKSHPCPGRSGSTCPAPRVLPRATRALCISYPSRRPHQSSEKLERRPEAEARCCHIHGRHVGLWSRADDRQRVCNSLLTLGSNLALTQI